MLSLGHKWEPSEYHIDPFAKIIGTDPKIVGARNIARRVARGDSSVVLYGETGTGKEIFAEAIHKAGSRAKGPFVPVNCAAIPEALVESELFGYEAGSFTGALRTGRLGKFEAAASGTIFLDEICDMSPLLQAKLLRTLQERTVERIGGTTQIPIDVRFITATNQDLEQMVADGLFRADLFYRLNVVKIELPPLRERVSDIERLSEYFIPILNARCKTSVTDIHPDVISVFRKYNWPGNVRELQNALEHALNFSDDNEIRREHLPIRILDSIYAPNIQAPEMTRQRFSLKDAIISAEHSMLVNALQKCGNNRTETAKLLGISRSTLYEKLKKHGVFCQESKAKARSRLPNPDPTGRKHGHRRKQPRT